MHNEPKPCATRRQVMTGLVAAGVMARTAPARALDQFLAEPALEPHLAITDAHQHLIDRGPSSAAGERRYLAEDFLDDVRRSGHRIEETIFIECGTRYRQGGPAEQRPLGETEYVAQIARSNAQAHPGGCALAKGIVARVDLRVGARAGELLAQHAQAAGGRLRGIRNSIAWDAYAPLAAMGLDPDLFSRTDFLEGFRELSRLGLCFDTWLFHPQIPRLTALARRFPKTTIVLNHCGHPLALGPYAGQEETVRAAWKQSMQALAECPHVNVKLGGLGPFGPLPGSGPKAHGSARLAEQWRPYIETTIELFGPHRCMFESNYPANAGTASYGATWNAFKRITAGYSADEKALLYRQTARRTYRL